MRSIVLTLAACAFAGMAFGGDPLLGTWRMNMEKSKFSPGPAPKSVTVTYTQEGDWIVLQTEAINPDGKPVSRTGRYKADGQEYPMEGPYGPAKMSAKKIDGHTMESTMKLDAGGSMVTRTVISADGKTRTLTVTGVNSKGEKVNNLIVFERQ
jgi:hypothetical protein